jgi:hypothetical protein
MLFTIGGGATGSIVGRAADPVPLLLPPPPPPDAQAAVSQRTVSPTVVLT